MYLKVFGLQTMTDISPGKKVPHLTGEMLILIPKIINIHVCIKKMWLEVSHDVLILLKVSLFTSQSFFVCVLDLNMSYL